METKIKSGIYTSEFWLSLLAVLVGAVVSSGLLPDTGPWVKGAGVISAMLGALGYSVSRGLVKSAASTIVPLLLLAGSGLTAAALLSGCCTTSRCYLSRGLTAVSACDKVAIPAIEKACSAKVQVCGKVAPASCPAYLSCAKQLAIYQASMDAIGRGLGAANRSLADLGVQ